MLHKGALVHLKLPNGEWLGKDECRLDNITGWMERNKSLFEGKRILDIGSNVGHFPIVMERCGGLVTAIEPEGSNVRIFKEIIKTFNSGITLIDKSLRHVDYSVLGEFDLLSTIGLIYHLNKPWEVMQSIINIVKPKVWLVESSVWDRVVEIREQTHSNNTALSFHSEMVLHPNVDEVIRGIKSCGFTPERVDLGPSYRSEDRTPRVFFKCDVAAPN